jgi:hypothetical protein
MSYQLSEDHYWTLQEAYHLIQLSRALTALRTRGADRDVVIEREALVTLFDTLIEKMDAPLREAAFQESPPEG